MKVVLLKRVSQLGWPGEVKEVSDGYARNFLIPRGLAVLATEAVINEWRHKAKVERRNKEQVLDQAKKIAKEFGRIVVEIKVKANEAGKLFGAVTREQLLSGLRSQGIELEQKYLDYREHIKTLGEHEVGYKLADGSRGKFKIKVERE
jgi:large subunit ribosomal protein L9